MRKNHGEQEKKETSELHLGQAAMPIFKWSLMSLQLRNPSQDQGKMELCDTFEQARGEDWMCKSSESEG